MNPVAIQKVAADLRAAIILEVADPLSGMSGRYQTQQRSKLLTISLARVRLKH